MEYVSDATYLKKVETLTDDLRAELSRQCCAIGAVFSPQFKPALYVVKLICEQHGNRDINIQVDATSNYLSDEFLKDEIRRKMLGLES